MKAQGALQGTLIAALVLSQALWAQEVDLNLDQDFDQVSSSDIQIDSQSQGQREVLRQRQVRPQKQPVTYIEASPLSDSRAEQMRRNRQDAELETEQKIVEKLEASRLEDEKRRASVLFGDRLQNMDSQSQVQQPAPVVVVPAAAPQVIQTVQPDPIQAELQVATSSESLQGIDQTKERYFFGQLGFGEYPSVKNVKANMNIGIGYGGKYNDNVIVEGAFLYSSYSIDSYASSYYANYYNSYGYGYGYSYDPYYNPYVSNSYSYVPAKIDVRQYSAQIASKYRFATGVIKPTLGGVIQYSYRDYSWGRNSYAYSYYLKNQSADSHAFDGAVSLGADFDMDDDFTLSLDYRYFMNIMYTTSNDELYYIYNPQAHNPLEKLDYYTVMLALRMRL